MAPGETLSLAEAMGSDTRSLPVTFPFHQDPSSSGLGRVPGSPQPSPLPGRALEPGEEGVKAGAGAEFAASLEQLGCFRAVVVLIRADRSPLVMQTLSAGTAGALR